MAILGVLLIFLSIPVAISYAIADEPRPQSRKRLAALVGGAGVVILLLSAVV